MASEDFSVIIKQIGPGDKLTGLSLGNPAFTPLKTFLQKHAQKYETQSLARTYGAFNEATGKVIAYVTLVCGEIVTDESAEDLVQEPGLDYSYHHYPAVKIARLAVDQRMAGNRIGTTLVNLALGQARRIICPTVGCRFVVVDSKRESVEFYEKCGFTMLDTADNRKRAAPVMWIDLNRVDLD